jgi:photosystem II stability/assembly factor-like uncharacterized protein
MKKIIYFQLIFLSSVYSVISQSGWFPLNSGTTKNLTDIYFVDQNTGFIAGESGTILKTTNGGVNWSSLNSGTSEWLYSIFFTNVNNGYSVGPLTNGVLRTTNGGNSWVAVYSQQAYPYALYFPNTLTGYCVGAGNQVVKTTNGGLNWFSKYVGSVNSFYSLYFSSPDSGLCGDGIGEVFKTVNGGDNWTITNPGVGGIYFMHFLNKNTGFVIGGNPNNNIAKTTDAGNTWFHNTNQGYSFGSVYFLDENTGYGSASLSNGSGVILHTTNGGTNWNAFNIDTAYTNYTGKVYFTDFNTGYAIGLKGIILKTTTGGLLLDTISTKYFPLSVGNVWVYYCTFDPYNGIWYDRYQITGTSVINGKTYYSVGHSRRIINTPQVFVETRLFTSSLPLRIDSTNATIYKSSNCGSSLEFLIDSLSSRKNDTALSCFYSPIACIDTSSYNIFGLLLPSKKFQSSNGLEGMDQQTYAKNIGLVYHYYTLHTQTSYANLTGCVINGILYGDTSTIFYTVSGTVHYQDNNQLVTKGFVKAVSLNRTTLQVVTRDSTGIQINGTYSLQHVPQDSIFIMAYADDENDFVPTYHDSTIYWQNAHIVYPTSNLNNINIAVFRVGNPVGQMHIGGNVFTSSMTLTGLSNAIVYSKIGNQFKRFGISGNTGSYLIDSLPQGSYQLICDRLGYDGGIRNVSLNSTNQDTINFYLDNIISVQKPGTNVPSSFKLYQNYPNPFNPTTTIKFDIPASPLAFGKGEGPGVRIIIYDILGREIIKLIDEQLTPGSYKVDWNASNYASGLYFYKLVAGDFVETKKLVLLK